MSYCLNIRCPKPVNPDRAAFCSACGMRLKLGDRFWAFQPTGVGNSSRTFLASDHSKLVNTRCIFKEYEQTGDGETWRREIMRLDPILQYPQIPRIYAYFERQGLIYLVQEFISGKSLLQEMQEFGAFDEEKIWALLHELLPVLQFLHQNRVIHRDVKPANLIRRDSGRTAGNLVLVDFGAAKYATRSALARVGTVIGSAEYVAPEQLLGQATFASDLYSLGVTCIHLLTGLPPFDLVNPADGQWIWRSVAGIVSDRLSRILDRLLAKNPEERYASVEEVQWDVKTSQSAAAAAALSLKRRPVTAPQPALTVSPVSGSRGRTDEVVWNLIQSDRVEVSVNAIALSQNWQDAYVGGNDGMVYRWAIDPASPDPYLKAHQQPIEAIAFAPDGRLATASRDRTIKLWDEQDLQFTLEGHRDIVTAIAFDASGQRLYSGSRDGLVHIWDIPSGSLLHRLEHSAPIETLFLNGDHPFLVCGDAQGAVHIWHTGTRERLRSLARHGAAVGAVVVADLEPMSIQSDPDRLVVVSSGWDMEIRVRNFNTGGLYRSLRGHRLPVAAIALCKGRQQIATASHDGTIRIWSLVHDSCIATLEGRNSPVLAIAFTETGGLVCGRQDGLLELWQGAV
jgi:serine/threonine protein kinase